MKRKIKDRTGQRFGRLVAIRPTEERVDGCVCWLCKCDCGNEKIVSTKYLVGGNTKSCGCLQLESLRNNAVKAYTARRKYFGCKYCGSNNHYANGLCNCCYQKYRRGTLFKR